MPRVHCIKKARKDNPAVKKGQPYYWWEFRYGGKRFSATYPKQSQLTQSGFLATIYDLNDEVGELEADTQEDLHNKLDDLAVRYREAGEECQESLDNMPDHLRDTSSSGELLQERIDACEDVATQLEDIAGRCDGDGDETVEDLIGEASSTQYEGG